jgi:L-threonylcarbamoyladenylate synthase
VGRAHVPERARLGGEEVKQLERCIAGGGVALLPTDTIYGLACDPTSAAAIRRLYEIKGRPPAQPSAVMFFSVGAALEALPELGPAERRALTTLLPGALTLLLPNPRGRFPLACAPAGTESQAARADGQPAAPALGLRVPRLPGPLAGLAAIGVPVMQSSANISGGAEARRLEEVPESVRKSVDLALDGGELPGVASTILDLRAYEREGSWRVLREGPLASAEIDGLLGGTG